jgi:hypothetical protein
MSVAFDETVLLHVASEVRTIKAQYRGVVPEESIDLVAEESLQRLAGSRVPQFVPLFVGRFTRERIREILASPTTDERGVRREDPTRSR